MDGAPLHLPPRKLTPQIVARSIALNVSFYVLYPLSMILGAFILLGSRKRAMRGLAWWSRVFVWLCRNLGGIGLEVRGREHIPHGTAIVAGKHQSLWETFALFHLLDDPAIVLKKELTYIPLVGQYIRKFHMIPVDRASGPRALKALIRAAREAMGENRQILIFPEGTRRPVGARPDYKPGVAALYGALKVPCVPLALNSGLYWPRRSFWRMPGTIIVEFLPPIEPGLPRKEFSARLIGAIEPAAQRLAQEGLRREGARKP